MESFFTQIRRTNPTTGAIERPWRMRERGLNGMFVLGDPAQGAQKHHKDNAVMVPSYSEALELVRKGFSIRMSDGRSPASLVSPGSLELVDEPVKHIDELWTYTMPEAPFTLDAVMEDLRAHLLEQAADIAIIANFDMASAFIGFEFDPLDDPENKEAAARIDLSRFHMARIVRRAYESAFRPWPSHEIAEDEVDDVERIIMSSFDRFKRDTPLGLTMMAAYHRASIVGGGFLANDEIDQSATEAIGRLTRMPAATVRSALNRDGLHLAKSKIDIQAVIDWVVTRRNFAPMRESELWEGRWAYRILHDFKTSPLEEAFASVRRRLHHATDDLAEAENVIRQRREAGQMPSHAEVRRYAAAVRVAPDTFILGLTDLWGGAVSAPETTSSNQ